jgi:hypothetical protein
VESLLGMLFPLCKKGTMKAETKLDGLDVGDVLGDVVGEILRLVVGVLEDGG